LAAGVHNLGLVGLEIEVEMFERMILDGARAVAQSLEFGQSVDRFPAPVDAVAPDVAERLLQLRIGERVSGIPLEGGRGDVHRFQPRPAIGGVLVMPASNSATWRIS